MAFALIFLIVLSIILIVGAFLIWKSDLPENDKIVSIIAILALFALVSIVNEAKKSSMDDTKFNLAELEKCFFAPKNLDIEYRYQLPLLNDYKDFVTSTLGEYRIDNSKSVAFLLLEGSPNVGKTLAFKEYVRMLQTEKIPALYIDLKNVGSNVYQLANHLKLSSLSILEEMVEKFNKNDRIPTLVLDHFEYVFSENDSAAASSLCSYLKELFDSRKINLILITNDSDVKLKLRADEGISRRLTVKGFAERSTDTIEKYLIDKYNPAVVKDGEKKFDPENIQYFLKTVGFSWNILNSYKIQIKDVQNVTDFCKTFISGVSIKLQERAEEKDVYKALLDAMWNPDTKNYQNKEVPYSIIKRYLSDELAAKKIKEGTRAGFLKVGHGTVCFANDAVMYAAIRAERPDDFNEL